MPAPSWNSTNWSKVESAVVPAWDVDGVTPIPMCANEGSPTYGDAIFDAAGTWASGYAPTSVTIDVTYSPAPPSLSGVNTLPAEFRVSTASDVVVVSLVDVVYPLVVNLSGLTGGDITRIEFRDVHGIYFDGSYHDICAQIDSVVFDGVSVCTHFWTNHVAQREVE